jgi:hypothetical protein
MSHPTAFISYSWDSEEHRAWVAKLAERLRGDGIDAKLDCWKVGPGEHLPELTEEMCSDAFVLIVCTPNYKRKSDAQNVGPDYEGGMMTAEVYRKLKQRKFIPVLARGTWEEAAPSWFPGKFYVDLSDPGSFERQYKDLVAKISRLEFLERDARESEARVQQSELYRAKFRDSAKDTE